MTPAPAAGAQRIGLALDLVAAAVMFALMALTCFDVAGRYFLKMPVPGGLELTEILMAVAIFAGLPLVTWRREHITVEIVNLARPPWLPAVQQRAVDMIGTLCLVVATWQLWVRAGRAVAAGDVTAQLKMPVAPTITLMAALTAAAAIGLAARALQRRPAAPPG